ncbi:MAG: hypothetical protein KAU50_05345 [Candidatus Marinimicrobia bacterium]|nr:hypothetical protein [Candidatus Neomarinimicrobiota bacterium]
MKRISNSWTSLLPLATILIMIAASCSLFDDQDTGENGVNPDGIYVLCEGNFGGGNASLWHLDKSYTEMTPNIIEHLTGDPLGDTGQSLAVAGERLYVVVNVSSQIQVLDLSGDAVSYVSTIDLTGAGPREMAIGNNQGYVTCWNIPGILTIDLNSLAVTDTLELAAIPEDIIYHDGALYVGLIMSADYSPDSTIIRIDPVKQSVTATYEVGPGPQHLLAADSVIYISRQWYDAGYNSYQGLAALNPVSGTVSTMEWGAGNGVDLFVVDEQLYLTTNSGIVPVATDLNPITDGSIGTEIEHIYSAGTDGINVLVGTADFNGPGQVIVLSTSGETLTVYTVGVGPGDFLTY